MRKSMSEFRQFILRGNVIDLAVGIVIGAAFTSVVQGFVDFLINPTIAATFGKPNFSHLVFHFRHGVFQYGELLSRIISFVLVGATVFFLVMKPINALALRLKLMPTTAAAMKDCPMCDLKIPEAAKRCPYCTSDLEPAVSGHPGATS